MSKIFEALENAEKERLRKGSSIFPGPKVEKKPDLVLGPKVEKNTTIVPGSKEDRMGRPEENPERQRVTELRKDPTPVLGPKEEKKTAPALEPKENRIERPQPGQPPKPVDLPKKVDPPKIVQPPKMVQPPRATDPPKMVRPPARPDRMQSDLPLVSLFQPGSLGAEQFRRLRTHVLKLNVSDPLKTIMVTSATAGEGKTFVAANLAAGIAHDLHFHAVLVDCDLRSPNLSHWFGIQNGHGLSDYLVGRGQLSELLMKTEMEKLSILTGGSAQGKPAELIGSRKMEALVHELKTRYNDRYVILDATPLLATTEPEVLARLVDGIIIVVRAGVTPRETVKQAIAPLDPKKIMGFVLNDVEFKSSGLFSRYFGSDGYYNHYGYSKRGGEPRSTSGKMSPFKKKSD